MSKPRWVSRLVDNKVDGTYWLNMSWEHDQTLIHIKPIFKVYKTPTEPPPPAGVPIRTALASGIGLTLLLFLLSFLLLLCCLCRSCPIYEYRKRRRKKAGHPERGDFTAPLFSGTEVLNGAPPIPVAAKSKLSSTPHANGTLNPIGKVDVGGRMLQSANMGADDEMEDSPKMDVGDKMLQSANMEPPPKKRSPSTVSPSIISTSRASSNGQALSEFGHLPGVARKVTGGTSYRTMSRRGTNWDIQTMRREQTGGLSEATVEVCRITSDSRLLVTGSHEDPPRVWDLMTGVLMRDMEGPEGEAAELMLAADDSIVVGLVSRLHSDAFGSALKIWDFSSSEQLEMGYPVIASAICLLNSDTEVLVCEVSADGTSLPSLVVWDLLGNEEAKRIPFRQPPDMGPMSCFSFLTVSSDDRFALAGFSSSLGLRSCYAVFDLSVTGVVISPHLIPFPCRLTCSALLSNNAEVVTGVRSGRLVVWSLVSGQPVRQLLTGSEAMSPHGAEISHLVLSQDGSLLVSADVQGIVMFWRTANEFNSAAISVPMLSCIAVSKDGYLIATGAANGRISLWRASGSEPLTELVTSAEITALHLAPDFSAIVAISSDRSALIMRLQQSNPATHQSLTRL